MCTMKYVYNLLSQLAEVSVYLHKHAVGVTNEVISNTVTAQAY